MEGGEVKKVIVRGGGKPKLAGPHTWVKYTFINVSKSIIIMGLKMKIKVWHLFNSEAAPAG